MSGREGQAPGFRGLSALLLAVLLAACAGDAPPEPPPAEPASVASGERAYGHLAALVALGPRPPGSQGSAQARAYLRTQLEALGLEVNEQHYTLDLAPPGEASDGAPPTGTSASAPPAETLEGEAAPETVEFTNLVAEIPGASSDLMVLVAPYDSQPFETFRFLGANDGASGAAVLLELARDFSADPLPYTTLLAFVEGDRPLRPELADESALYGSRLLVQSLGEQQLLPRVRLAVYFNQVGDRELRIARDLRSHRQYRNRFSEAARRLGHADAFPEDAAPDSPVGGHLAFWGAGMRRVVAIIDDRYGGDEPPGVHARSESDALEQNAPESLGVVAAVSEAALRDIGGMLARIDRFVRRPEGSPAAEPMPQPAEGEAVPGGGAAEAAGELPPPAGESFEDTSGES